MSAIKSVISVISDRYEVHDDWEKYNPFETLINIMLSQSTHWRNVDAAMENFIREFKEIDDVARAEIAEIEKVIRPAGFHRVRAIRISKLARSLQRNYSGYLEEIMHLPYSEAKDKLIALEGIGPKTADVFLMAVRGEKVLPIDVHIFRVMKRIGVANNSDGYESLRAKLENEVLPDDRARVHLALINFGRQVCKSQKPKCDICPIKEECKRENGLDQEGNFI
jgi:endonuclease III